MDRTVPRVLWWFELHMHCDRDLNTDAGWREFSVMGMIPGWGARLGAAE